jgi:hypothetical protein
MKQKILFIVVILLYILLVSVLGTSCTSTHRLTEKKNSHIDSARVEKSDSVVISKTDSAKTVVSGEVGFITTEDTSTTETVTENFSTDGKLASKTIVKEKKHVKKTERAVKTSVSENKAQISTTQNVSKSDSSRVIAKNKTVSVDVKKKKFHWLYVLLLLLAVLAYVNRDKIKHWLSLFFFGGFIGCITPDKGVVLHEHAVIVTKIDTVQRYQQTVGQWYYLGCVSVRDLNNNVFPLYPYKVLPVPYKIGDTLTCYFNK